MKTKLNLLAAGIFLAALSTGFGQPIIINQPQSQTNAVGTTATFWVEATNSAPLGIADFLDSAAQDYPSRFYRTRPE